jgi:hypothetical protein
MLIHALQDVITANLLCIIPDTSLAFLFWGAQLYLFYCFVIYETQHLGSIDGYIWWVVYMWIDITLLSQAIIKTVWSI